MPLYDRNIGRRTGVDVKAGKNIRILENGFENFSDYWTDESETEDTYEQILLQQEKENDAVKSAKQTKNKIKVRSMSPFSSVDRSHDNSVSGVHTLSRLATETSTEKSLNKPSTSSSLESAKPTSGSKTLTKESTKKAENKLTASDKEPTEGVQVSTEEKAAEEFTDKEETDGEETKNNDHAKEKDKYSSVSIQKQTGGEGEGEEEEEDLNTAGEVNGTITRGEQVLDFKKAKISSAVQSFKTRKRLTYSTSPDTAVDDSHKQASLQPKATVSEFKVPFPKSKSSSPRKSGAMPPGEKNTISQPDKSSVVTSASAGSKNTCQKSSLTQNSSKDEESTQKTHADKTKESSPRISKNTTKKSTPKVIDNKGNVSESVMNNEGREDSNTKEESDLDHDESQTRRADNENSQQKQSVLDRKTTDGIGSEMNENAADQCQVDENEVPASDSEKDENEDSCTFATLSQKQPVKSIAKKRKSSVEIELKLLKNQEAETLRAVKTAKIQSIKEKKKNSKGKKKVTGQKEQTDNGGNKDGTSPNKRQRQSSAEDLVQGLPPLPTKPGRKAKKKEDHVTQPQEEEESGDNTKPQEKTKQKNKKAAETFGDSVTAQPENEILQQFIEEHLELKGRVTRSKGSQGKGKDNNNGNDQEARTLKKKVSNKGKKGKVKEKITKQTIEDIPSSFRVIGQISFNTGGEEESNIQLPDKEMDQQKWEFDTEKEKPNENSSKLSKKSQKNKKGGKPMNKPKESVTKSSLVQERNEESPVKSQNVNIDDVEQKEVDKLGKEDVSCSNETVVGDLEKDLGQKDSGPMDSVNSGVNKQLNVTGGQEQIPSLSGNKDLELEESVPDCENPSHVGGGDCNEPDSEDDFEVVESKMSMRKLSIESNGRRRSKSSKGSSSQEEESEGRTGSKKDSSKSSDAEGNKNGDLLVQATPDKHSSDEEVFDKTKPQKKAKQKSVKKSKAAVKVVKKMKKSNRNPDSFVSSDGHVMEEVDEQVKVPKEKHTNKDKQEKKKGKQGKVKASKSVKGAYVNSQSYRDVNNVNTQSESEATADLVKKKTRGRPGKRKPKVSSDMNTGTDSELETAKALKLKTDQSKKSQTVRKNADPQVVNNLTQVMEKLEFQKASQMREDQMKAGLKDRSAKTNVINSTRVNTVGDDFENDEDISRLMPSPNLSPIKRILTKRGQVRKESNLVNLTRRSQCPSTPTTVTKRRKRKLIGEESSEGGTDNSLASVLHNSGSAQVPITPAENVMSPDKGIDNQEDDNVCDRESPVEADDEMVSPPEHKRSKKMTPVHHKGKKKKRTSSASGECSTPPRPIQLKGRKVQLNTTPLPPTPSTTPGKHIKSILKNSRFRNRTGAQDKSLNAREVVTPVRTMGKRRSASEAENSQSPMHIYEVTESQTPKAVRITPPVKKEVKIILPEAAPNSGVRRSQRTRVPCLDWYKNERIDYEKRKSGGLVIKGVIIPEQQETMATEPTATAIRKQKQKGLKQKRRRRAAPATPRNLSMHTDPPDDYEEIESAEVPVLDPDTGDDVLIECIKTKDDYEYVTPEGKDPTESDPLILTKIMKQRAFSVGMLVLRPFEEKEMQFVRKDTIIFIVKYGKLAVTIHRTSVILETDATFFVPQGNTYSIKNLRCEEAKLWFFRHIGEKPVIPSSRKKTPVKSRQ